MYDAENRLTSVSGAAAATFVYDGDGNRVKATVGGVTTVYIGNIYERDNGTTVRKYYYAGGVRVAMRTGGQTYYLLGDHLGGTNVTTNGSGAQVASLLYKPWGETRYDFGVTPTTWRFTGQREDATIGLYFYNARYYDPLLGRFTQPDTIVPEPGDPQALNRYSYTLNNPIRYTDPSGHAQVCADGDEGGGCGAGANTAHIWQTFAGRRSSLLDYYALLHQLTQAQANGASAVEVEALAGAVESAYAAGSAWLPQHQFDPAVVVEPASLVSLGGAITSGGMRALGTAVSTASRSKPNTPHPSSASSQLTGTKVYRVWGTEPNAPDFTRQSGPWGSSWTTTDPSTVPNYRAYAGLPSGGASGALNAGRFVSEGIIRDPSGIQLRSALSLDGQPGGLIEVLIPNPRTQIDLRGVYGVNPPY